MKKRNLMILALLLVIGFASVSTTLVLNGTIGVGANEDDFSVIFTSATINGTGATATIDDTKKKITFISSKLTNVGEKSILDYTIKNNSTQYDADVTINCSNDASVYISLTNTLADEKITENYKTTFVAQEEKSGSITAELVKSSTEENDSTAVICTIVANATERDSKVEAIVPVQPVSFADDSWETIQKAAKSGVNPYKLGDTKCVPMVDADWYFKDVWTGCEEGEAVVELVNKTECTNELSETACGFVIQFRDAFIYDAMNGEDESTSTNLGGWPESKARTILNEEVYNWLPSDLQDVIIDTKVVSGHGSAETENFVSTDKLYLFSASEISLKGELDYVSTIETTVDSTRRLDYKQLGRIKTDTYDATQLNYWLRSADKTSSNKFLYVTFDGGFDMKYSHLGRVVEGGTSSYDIVGFSPAFRIA